MSDTIEIAYLPDENGVFWFVLKAIEAPGLLIDPIYGHNDDGAPTVRLTIRRRPPTAYKVVNPLGATVRSMPFERGGWQGYLAPGAKVIAAGPIQYVEGNQWLPIEYPKQPAYVAIIFNGKEKLKPV
jgi:hypothetical protein